ncbi:Long-chain-fatty-acid--CoA ligase [Solibacillus isronensis B3W22]|uniref:Long-chain-fatty-acid--CoA ligase n=1 Tax=Solibacillus isronensis B3W22 TaxID=1224748 RepID=K1KLW6_9BACL|nr:AMP-binding protein [Solibacillus isronensis]AMO86544.1 o-succinylbenzoate--CoA ligase [Solibacillus silvestris]EKB45125.1 Long-chain-fatty-acid--CoA ligase [Solibacillus isronensis B3W22]
MNISNLLARHARKYPNQIAVISLGQETTYQQLDEQVNKIAGSLRASGIVKGDKVGIFMPNVKEFVALYFAIQRVGAVVVPINAKFVTREIEYVLNHSDAKAIFVHELIFEQAATIMFNGLKVKTGPVIHDWQSFNQFEAEGNEVVCCDLVEDDLSTLLYTSGTTGNPKGVLLTNRNVLAVSHMIAIEMEVKPESRMLIMMPLTHSAPLNLFLVTAVLVGATAVLTPTFTPDLLIDTVEKYKTTHFFGAPVAYLLTAGSPRIANADLSSMKWWVYGGAPLSEKEVVYIQQQFNTDNLVCVYGLTEAGPSGSILHAADHPHKAGSIGKRAPFGTELRVINSLNENVAPGEIGEIILYGEGNMKEYYKNPDETKNIFIDGWVRSGDLARIDEEGYIYIVDRKKDVIISGGVNIYPKEIEDQLLQHEAIFEVAVFGVPHPEWGETVKAVYCAKVPVSEQEIREHLENRLAAFKIPKIYEQVEALPRNASGKILKQQLRGEANASVSQ